MPRSRRVLAVAALGLLAAAAPVAVQVASAAGAGAPAPTRAARPGAYAPAGSEGTAPHETRLAFPGTPGYAGRYTWQPLSEYDPSVPGGEAASAVYLDPRDQPPGAVFFVRATTGALERDAEQGVCLRLYDATLQRPVAGSQVCRTVPASATRSYHVDDGPPLRLPAGEHAYVLQGLLAHPADEVLLAHAELVVRWRE